MTLEMRKRRSRNWRSARGKRKFRRNGADIRLLEKMFYSYKDIKREVTEIKDEKSYYQSGHKEGGGSSNHAFISDPTSQLALKHIDEIKRIMIDDTTINYPERWIFVVEQTLNYYKNDKIILEIITRRYFKNEGYGRTCTELEIENVDDYYAAKDAGLGYARDCAIQIGLIKVF